MISSLSTSVFLVLFGSLAGVNGGAILVPRRGVENTGTSSCIMATCTTALSSTPSIESSSDAAGSTLSLASGTPASAGVVIEVPVVAPSVESTSSAVLESSTSGVKTATVFLTTTIIYSGEEAAQTSASKSIVDATSTSSISETASVPTFANSTSFAVWSNTTTSDAPNPEATVGMVLVGLQIVGDATTTTAKITSKPVVNIILPPAKAAATKSSTFTTSSSSSITSASEMVLSTSSSGEGATTFTSLTATNVTILAVTSASSSGYSNSSTAAWLNSTFTTSESVITPTATLDCISLTPGATWTVYSMLLNTSTSYGTVTLGVSTTFTMIPEFTPPTKCPTTTAAALMSTAVVGSTALKISSSSSSTKKSKTTTVTVLITSKNGYTVLTTVTPPGYNGETEAKVTVTGGGGKVDLPGISIPPVSTTPKKTVVIPLTTSAEAAFAAVSTFPASTVTSVAADGVTVVVSPSDVVIGSQKVELVPSSTQLVTAANNVVYTVEAGKVVGPSLTVSVPITSLVAAPVVAPVVTPTAPATNLVILDPEPFSIIGSSIIVLGSSTITYGPTVTYASGKTSTTSVVNGEVITIGPSGVTIDKTTLGGTAHSTGTLIGLAGGLTITEIGSTIAIINGATLTIGPSAAALTTVISGHTITAGSVGLDIGGTTLTDFNPSTVAITAGGVTFTAIGSSIAVIGGSTYTYGGNAKQTTTVVNGQTVSIGPSGIGFASTTFVSYSPTATPTIAGATAAAKSSGAEAASASPSSTTKKSSGARTGPLGGLILLVSLFVAYML